MKTEKLLMSNIDLSKFWKIKNLQHFLQPIVNFKKNVKKIINKVDKISIKKENLNLLQ